MALNELSWFTAVGFIYDVEQPNPSGATIQPQLLDVSAYVDFYPGNESESFPNGFTVLVANLDHGDDTSGDTMVPLAPISGRMMNGALSSIVIGDPPNVELLAGSTVLNLTEPLFYHVKFQNATWQGGVPFAISNFAFQAPTGQDSPTNLVGTPSATGGSLAAGTYYYGVTAVMPWGETAPIIIDAVIASGTTGSVALTWAVPSGATGSNIYRGTSATTLTTLVHQNTGGTSTFTDTGGAGTSQSPTLNSAGTAYTDMLDITSPTLQQYAYNGP